MTLAIVTGANRGIGLEVVRRLAARGTTTVLGARDPARGERAARGIDGPVLVRQLDVTDPASVAAFAQRVGDEHGRVDQDGGVDVLVHNAGVHYDTGQSAVEADLRIVEEALATNVVGAWRLTVALAPLLRRGARVVTVSSGAGSFAETGGGGRRPGLLRVEGGPGHADREAGRRPAPARRARQRRLPGLGRHRHGRGGRAPGR